MEVRDVGGPGENVEVTGAERIKLLDPIMKQREARVINGSLHLYLGVT